MKKILALNLKMNFDYSEAKNYISALKDQINSSDVVLFPPTIFLPYFISKDYAFGAQNVSEFDNGAHTGETSCSQLKSLGGSYALIGHSERRLGQKEDDETINLKIKKALEKKLKVILCVGETKEEHDMLKTSKVLKTEVINALKGIDQKSLENVIIAYEPIWSIGTGKIPTIKDIEDTAAFITDIASLRYNFKPRILYGGSVDEKNIAKLNEIECLSGFLIGSSSLDVNKILKIKEVVLK